MAIKISGTTVIDDSRDINNIGIVTISDTLTVGTAITAHAGIITATKYGTYGSPSKDKFRVWSGASYVIGMDNAMSFGGLNDYAMTFKMNSDDDRGWWWGDSAHSDAQGAMTLNTIGELVVAKSIRAGGGESDTSAPIKPLDITGDGIISGDVGIGTTSPDTLLHLSSTNPAIRLTAENQAANNKNWNITAGSTQLLRIQAINDAGGGGGNLFDFYRLNNQVNEFRGVNSANTWFVVDNSNKEVGIGTDNSTGAAALTNNDTRLVVGIVTTNSVYGKLNNLTYPTANGTDGQVLTSDGAGVVQWEEASGGGGISMGKAIAAAMVFG